MNSEVFTLCASVLQENLKPQEISLYKNGGNGNNPVTVLTPGTDYIKKYGRVGILKNSHANILVDPAGPSINWAVITEEGGYKKKPYMHYNKDDSEKSTGLVVPTEIVQYYGLKDGDFVDIVIDRKDQVLYISAVNTISDITLIKSRPLNLIKFRSDYPSKPLSLDSFGNLDIRVMYLLSPIGLGSSHWIVAPGGSGKTWLLNEILDACLSLTLTTKKLFVIMLCVGDRPEDESIFVETLNKNRRSRGEIYSAPWNTEPDHQIDVAVFAKNRADSLVAEGWDVVFIVDSLTRAVSIHSSSSHVNTKTGWISGGIYRDSLIQMVALLFGTHGDFIDPEGVYDPGSLTIIATALEGSTDPISEDTKDSSTTGITTLRSYGDIWPRIDIHHTHVRLPLGKDFRSKITRMEMDFVKNEMGKILRRPKAPGVDNSAESFVFLVDHAKRFPTPYDFYEFVKSKIS